MTNTSITRKTKKTEVDTIPLLTPEREAPVSITSITFDKNGNLYGVSDSGQLHLFNFDTKKWGQI
jgi:hypothetical protein